MFNLLNREDTYSFVSVEEEKYLFIRAKRKKDKWLILDYFTNLSLLDEGQNKLSLDDLKNKIRDNGWDKDICYVIIPRYEVTSRIVTLPSQDPGEVKNMVELSAEEYVPYSTEEIQTTQTILENLSNLESRVFVAIAHKDVVNERIEIVKDLGLVPRGVLVSTAGLLDLPALCRKRLLPKDDIYAILHLSLQGLEIAICKGERILFSRGAKIQWSRYLENERDLETINDEIPPEGKEVRLISLAEFDEPKSDLVGEIRRELRVSLNTLQQETEFEGELKHIIVSSDFKVPSELREEIRTVLEEDVKFIDIEVFNLVEPKCELPENFSLPILGLLYSIGKGETLKLDLLPEEIATAQSLEYFSRHMLVVGCLLLVLITVLGGLFAQSVYQRKKIIKELENQVKNIEVNAKGIAEKRYQLQILRRETAKIGSALHYLSEIMMSAPPKVNINTYSYRRQEGINIWGRANSVDDVHRFAENLRRQAITSGLNALKQARSVYEQQTTEQSVTVFDYQITIPFVEEEEVDSATVKSP
ncbi:MAG: pilus assembly protein PilM [Candidatus Hydrogenedentes bacterium]|nr:pilus assembly protein PilM [Candidatus Hydrogenedentota bacterium]